MKSKILVGLSLLGLSLGTFAVGCGDSGGTTGSGGGTGTGGTGTTTTTGVTVSSAGGGGTGGGSTDGNDTIATAEAMTEDAMNPGVFVGQGELNPPDTDVDFFSFDGVAGPALIYSDAMPSTDPFADGYVDLVVTLFDAQGQQIAQNDDPFPRTTQDSEFYTVLPANGKYFVKVEEFCEFAGTGCPADYFTNLTDLAFAVAYIPLDPADVGTANEATEPNDTLGTATAMEYAPVPMMAGSYYLSLGYGDLTPGNDVDGYKFTIPADVTVDGASRLNGSFDFPPPGTDGNGSSINPGLVQIIDPTNANAIVAQIDMSAEENSTGRASIFAPLTGGHEYLLKLGAGPASTGADPFYFVLHGSGSGNPLETNEAGNNTTPEVLTVAAGTTNYYIEGDLAQGDIDQFSLAKQTGVLTVVCGSQRSGSGVRALNATVLKGSDGTTSLGMASETASKDLVSAEIDPGAETSVIVKLSAGTHDANVISSFYRCGFIFAPPAP